MMPATSFAPEAIPAPPPVAVPRATLTALAVAYTALAAVLVTAIGRQHSLASTGIMVTSLVMFPICVASATQLLGWPAARMFVLIALAVGWFAEQMGSTDGWFFGRYTYTAVLGPRLGNVPVIIPMMWFVLTYTGYVLANLILWQRPVDDGRTGGAGTSFIAAMIVTAYDLGADPYLVYVVKAWIMAKTNGAWFGETVQGFVGWTFIGFVILHGFRLHGCRPHGFRRDGWRQASLRVPPVTPTRAMTRATLVPIAVYTSGVLFQATFGYPVETRSIAIFAMGIPLLCALHGWRQWRAAQPAGVAVAA